MFTVSDSFLCLTKDQLKDLNCHQRPLQAGGIAALTELHSKGI